MKKILTLLTVFFVAISTFAADYVKVTSTSNLTDGTYLIVYETGGLAFDGSLTTLDAMGNTISVTISNSAITATDDIDKSSFYYDATNKTLKSVSGYYIGQTSNANGLASNQSTTYSNTITISGGDADIVSSSAHLRYNSASNQKRFRYYKSSSYTGQKAIQLYKRTSPITPPQPQLDELNDISDFKALDANKAFQFNGDVVCVQDYTANSHRYLYVVDNTGGMLIYDPDSSTLQYKTRDIIPGGWSGTKTVYKNLPEATSAADFEESSELTHIDPAEITIANVTNDNYGDWVIIRNVQIRQKAQTNAPSLRAATGPSIQETSNLEISDGTNTMDIYAGHTEDFNLPDDWETETYDVVGVLGVYNTTKQIMPTGIMKNNEIITGGIDKITNKSQIKSIKYYNVQGIVSDTPFDGFNLKVIEFNNGQKSVFKHIQ